MRVSRLGAYVASTTLALSGLTLVTAPAEAAEHDPIGLTQGASWLEGQLTNGIVRNGEWKFDDLGLSVDFALALDAVGARDAAVDTIVGALGPRAKEYYTSTYEGVTTTYGGSLAKLAVLAVEAGENPASFGGEDLITQLEAQVAADAPVSGRLQNTNDAWGDANVLGQAYAVNALSTAGSAEAADATAFLLQQQCAEGFFRLNFSPATAVSQSCDADSGTPDTDATAIAVLQLASQSRSGVVQESVARAKAWLVAQQKTDGSWGGGTSTEGSNSNSTGLAAWALGDTPASEKAAQWLRARQATYYDICDRLANDRGAVAYDEAALGAGRTEGITVPKQDQWRRASAQAVPALAYLPVDATPAQPALTAPSGYLRAGSTQTFETQGVNAGDQLCLKGTGVSVQGTAPGTSWSQQVTLPAGSSNRTYIVRDADNHFARTTVKVLDAKTLTVSRTPGRVKRSSTVTVVASGLAPGEEGRIFYGSRLVKSSTASSTGRLVARFSSGRSLGLKSIRAYGQFSDIRKGATSVRVVR